MQVRDPADAGSRFDKRGKVLNKKDTVLDSEISTAGVIVLISRYV